MDIKMPIMNGIDALREIRKIYVDLPVILSVFTFDTDKIAAKQADSTDFITKPISASQLIYSIEKYLSL